MKTLVRRKARPRSWGRIAVRRMPSPGALALRDSARAHAAPISTLMIGGAHDPAEKAADAMADRVLRMPAAPTVHRKCEGCEEKDKLARPKSDGGGAGSGTMAASPAAAHAVASLGTGKPLASAERAFFEPRFGADLSAVRVHEDAAADRAARAMNARAFALGSDIALAAGESRDGEQGRRLMAHELAHVMQGGRAGQVHRSCDDGDCKTCAGGKKYLWITFFFRTRATQKTMDAIRADVASSSEILKKCCIHLNVQYDWTLRKGDKVVNPGKVRPDASADGVWEYPDDLKDIGGSKAFKGAKGVPALVVDEVTGSGGGATVTSAADKSYRGKNYFIFATTDTNLSCPTVAHELSHVGGIIGHDEAKGGQIGACTGTGVSPAYCEKVRSLA